MKKKKNVIVFIFYTSTLLFKPICICLFTRNWKKENIFKKRCFITTNSKLQLSFFLELILKTLPGMRGLFIGVHSLCSFFQEPFFIQEKSSSILCIISKVIYDSPLLGSNKSIERLEFKH